MFVLLAQAAESSSMTDFDVVVSLFSRVDTLAHPTNLVESLQQLSVVWAVIFLIAGIVSLFSGYRYYKAVTITMALAIGLFGGYVLGLQIRAPYIVAGCLALLAAVVCWPLMKYAVALMGGIAGAFLGANAWSAIFAWLHSTDGMMQYDPSLTGHWIGALIGLLFCGMLAFILFKLSAVFFTSLSGATIAMMGMLALLLHIPAFGPTVASTVSDNSIVLPLLVVIPATIGLILQQSQKEVNPDVA